jgi:GT2 family glycosyltransferase
VRIGYVCTSYNNSRLTRDAVASLHAGGHGADVRVVLVDNASTPEHAEVLRATAREFPDVELVTLPENIGYFKGLNTGLRRLREAHPDIEHVVIGNDDVLFPPDFAPTMQRHRAVFDEWAVIAPDLVGLDGIHQNPHVYHPISRARKLVWDVYFSSYAGAVVVRNLARLTRRFTVREENTAASTLHLTPGPIEQGYGALYILGPVFFRRLGLFVAPTFVYQEEYFLTEQLATIGQRVYYDPTFKVKHLHHSTMGALPRQRHFRIGRDSHRVYKRYLAMSAAERLAFLREHTGATA